MKRVTTSDRCQLQVIAAVNSAIATQISTNSLRAIDNFLRNSLSIGVAGF